MLTLHNLNVYQKALVFAARAEKFSGSWGRRQAIVDHFRRASESIVLDVYKVGLDFMRWFVQLPGGADLSSRMCRQIDQAASSMVLNIAEGNGRYSKLDQRRFLEIAASSAAKARVYLDLHERKSTPLQLETAEGIELLNRVLAMLGSF